MCMVCMSAVASRSSLVLSVCLSQTYKPDPDSEELAYDVHFWIGANSTQVTDDVCCIH